MAETVEYRQLRLEFNRKLKMIRGHTAAAKLFMESGDLQRAYEEAENIQLIGFDAKDLLGKLAQSNE